jgi:hypothetical protein
MATTNSSPDWIDATDHAGGSVTLQAGPHKLEIQLKLLPHAPQVPLTNLDSRALMAQFDQALMKHVTPTAFMVLKTILGRVFEKEREEYLRAGGVKQELEEPVTESVTAVYRRQRALEIASASEGSVAGPQLEPPPLHQQAASVPESPAAADDADKKIEAKKKRGGTENLTWQRQLIKETIDQRQKIELIYCVFRDIQLRGTKILTEGARSHYNFVTRKIGFCIDECHAGNIDEFYASKWTPVFVSSCKKFQCEDCNKRNAGRRRSKYGLGAARAAVLAGQPLAPLEPLIDLLKIAQQRQRSGPAAPGFAADHAVELVDDEVGEGARKKPRNEQEESEKPLAI